MPPPEAPVETGSPGAWPSIEDQIGSPLPRDYKEYINIYGTGSLGGFLWPYNPFSKNQNLNLLRRAQLDASALRQLREEFGEEEVPFPLHPEPGGLLSWGVTDNGDGLYWLTVGDPDAWPVVVNEARGPQFERYEESATSFLARLISGEIVSEALPAGVFEGEVEFKPVGED